MPLIEKDTTIYLKDNILKMINRLSEEIKNGDEIVYEKTGSEIWWCWKNIRTNEKHIIRLVDIKKLDQTIYIEAVLSFAKNEMNAIEAANYINKISKLKTFL